MQPSTRASNVALAPPKQELVLTDLWLIIRKRRVLIIALSLGLAILAAAAGLYRGKRFTASGEIQIQPGSAADLKQSVASVLSTGASSTLDVVIESDIRILESDKLLMAVARTLNLQNNIEFLGGKTSIKPGLIHGATIPLYHGNLDDPFVSYAILKNLRMHLTIVRVPRTQMITISYKSKSRKLAADIVNELETEFIKNNFTAHFNTTQQVSNWLTGQIDDLRAIVQDSQDRMVDLQKKLGISALDPNHSLIVQEIGDLEKGASDAMEQRVALEARYRILESLPPDQVQEAPTLLGTDGPQGILSTLRTQRDSAAAELARLQPVYGPNYPQVKQLNAQIKTLDRQIESQQRRTVSRAKDALAIAQADQDRADAALNDRLRQLYGQRDDIVRYELLSEQYESDRRMYESIMARLREAAVDAGLDSADISIVDLAPLPTVPSSMSPFSLAAIGLGFGLFGGLALSLLLERMDTRMRDSKEIQELLGVPAVAIIPQTSWKGDETSPDLKVGPEILWDFRSPFAEAIRVFRTSIQLSSTSRESRVIAITSCQPGEGKSTLSMNLAAALAQGGKKVALVDTDMRRPSVYWRLGLSDKKGLSEFLTGLEPLNEVVQTHKTLPTLDVVPSGVCPPLPADLLASDQMKQFVHSLRERYDYVIFDTPPALSVTDPLIVGTLSDGVVLAIRQGYCTRAMLSRAAEIFRDVQIKVYGFVLNGVDPNLPEYYGYLGYYSYEYKHRN
ncbi:MAG TPA: polysaccharide biosynthesis tyrosine autokinase [Terracidiphilus sp.]|nr:polysaccharide biosynthesis tyrosine autokinase [Terracidiphilus sp.]